MKKIILTVLGGLSLGAFSQARVQAIHNSPDAAADTVDVYINTLLGSSLLIDDFAFRTATPFIDAPAGVPISLSIAPKGSTGIADTIPGLTTAFNLINGETYVVVAEGFVNPAGYSTAQPFALNAFASGREAAANSGETDVLVLHGSTDAPTVDIDERTAGNLVNDASFGDFAGYLELPTADYTLDIKDASGAVTVASFQAPLTTLSLQDSALVVLASGFLDPTVNNNGPAFGLWVALPNGGNLIPLPTAPAPTARVQVIHNSPDALTDTVDVYLGSTLLLNDFAFRTASPFIDAPAENPIRVSFAPKTSTSVADTLAGLSFDFNLDANETYVVVAEGLVSTSGYTPLQAFNLNVFATGREVAANSGETDVLVLHGSTDAPTVDVNERTAGNLVNDASYGDFAGYLELATADYILDIKDASGTVDVASFGAPLSTLSLQDSAIVVLASGFLDPTVNNNGPSFGLWVALPNGGNLIPLPSVTGPTTSIDDNEIVKFNMYPNPANDLITVDGLNLNNTNVVITSIDGKTINSSLYTVSNGQINIQSLVKGTYMVTLIKENKITGNASFIKM